MKVLFTTLLLIKILLFTACGVKYTPVYIPQKCEIEIPKRPKMLQGNIHNIRQILEYTERLEYNLKFCIEGS